MLVMNAANRDPTRIRKVPAEPSPELETLDMARRGRYLALLRRWAQERLPAEWIRDVLIRTDGSDRDAPRADGSLLVWLRSRLLADRPQRARLADRSIPPARVEQLIGCAQLDAWERALATLPRRQRELVILRIEFGLDFEAIAAETRVALPFARAETVNALAALIDALGGTSRGQAA